MNDIIIRDCWNIIHKSDIKFLFDTRQPLINIEKYLSYFNLPLLPPTEVKTNTLLDSYSIEPSFKNLTDNILLSLRHHIYGQTELTTVSKWAEKLMRFCEVRYRTLKTRAIEKCNSKAAAQLHLLHLAAFFMDIAIYTKDIRLLNTVLKLADLKWLLNRNRIKNNLTMKNNDFISALFQFRIIITTEYVVSQLYKDEMI